VSSAGRGKPAGRIGRGARAACASALAFLVTAGAAAPDDRPAPAARTDATQDRADAKPPSAALTEAEWRWLEAGRPALAWGLAQGLPLEVTVLPRAEDGFSPLSLGFEAVGGQAPRCRLVLGLRGNPSGQAAWDAMDPALRPVAVQAMFAHEIAHCWRRVQGGWSAGPQAERAEEGFADLAALAWTWARHPAQAAALAGWLEQRRAFAPAGSSHDTRPWLAAARRAWPEGAPGGVPPLEAALGLWASVGPQP
jgi:hypothetical protein